MRFFRDVQKPCRRASLITGASIREPGEVHLPGLSENIRKVYLDSLIGPGGH
jgi:hypothetical protein